MKINGTEKKKRPRYIYVLVLLIALLSVAISIYFILRIRMLAWIFIIPTIYFTIIIISNLLIYFNENITEKWKKPKYVYIMMILVIILFSATIIYCVLHFRWFAPKQYDMPPAAVIPIPTYVVLLTMYLPIFGVLLSPRMYSGKPKETWRIRTFYFMISLLIAFGIVYIGLAFRIIPKMLLDTELFFNFSSPTILSLLTLILSILIFHLKDRDETNEKEENAIVN